MLPLRRAVGAGGRADVAERGGDEAAHWKGVERSVLGFR